MQNEGDTSIIGLSAPFLFGIIIPSHLNLLEKYIEESLMAVNYELVVMFPIRYNM